MEKSITIIIPVFNEAECLPQLTKEVIAFLPHAPLEVTILFVNDGSTDGTQEIIESVCNNNNCFHFLQLHKNQGLSAALKAGFDYCKTNLVGYMDADLQTSPLDFIKLLEFIPEYDIVIGIRMKRRDGFVKRISSVMANKVRRFMIDDGITDTGCPLKIIKTEYAQRIPFFNGMHRFIPALVQLTGGKVKQVPVSHYPRYAGVSKYTLRNRLVNPFIDTVAFRWMKKRYIHYKIEKQA